MFKKRSEVFLMRNFKLFMFAMSKKICVTLKAFAIFQSSVNKQNVSRVSILNLK